MKVPITPIGYQVTEWHRRNCGHGAHGMSPAQHAARLLREAVEFCLAAGLGSIGVQRVVEEEIDKELSIDPFVCDESGLIQATKELTDVLILAEVWNGYFGIDMPFEMVKTLERCKSRNWRADEYGVLWRDRTTKS